MRDFTPNSPHQGASIIADVNSETIFFQRIYGWMFSALLVTAGATLLLARSEAWLRMMTGGGILPLIVGLAPFGISIFMVARIEHMSPSAIRTVMFLIAALIGGTLAVVYALLPISGNAVFAKAFICSAGTYGAMAVYGLVTKRSLQAWGSFLFMGVIGIILTLLVNGLFFKSPAVDYAVTIIGILVFAALTAYHHQSLRVMFFSIQQEGGNENSMKMAVALGAYMLYINFLNLFTFFLNLFLSRE